MSRFLRVSIVILTMAVAMAAQTNDEARLKLWSKEVGFWGGYSPDSTIGIGKVSDRKFFELNGQYAVTILAGRYAALKWVTEFVPVALLNEPTEYYFNNEHKQTGSRAGGTTYGAGMTPLGCR